MMFFGVTSTNVGHEDSSKSAHSVFKIGTSQDVPWCLDATLQNLDTRMIATRVKLLVAHDLLESCTVLDLFESQGDANPA